MATLALDLHSFAQLISHEMPRVAYCRCRVVDHELHLELIDIKIFHFLPDVTLGIQGRLVAPNRVRLELTLRRAPLGTKHLLRGALWLLRKAGFDFVHQEFMQVNGDQVDIHLDRMRLPDGRRLLDLVNVQSVSVPGRAGTAFSAEFMIREP